MTLFLFAYYCLCYYNLSRDYNFQKHDVTIKLHETNNINKRTEFVLLLCCGLIMARCQQPEQSGHETSTSSLSV